MDMTVMATMKRMMVEKTRCSPCAQGEMAAMFLRHEGFLGAMGAFLKVHPMEPNLEATNAKEPRKVCCIAGPMMNPPDHCTMDTLSLVWFGSSDQQCMQNGDIFVLYLDT